MFSEQAALRSLAAAAAATAVIGAVVMRRWDIHAGKQVADLARARASDEWRFEERVAELEGDIEESRELRGKLEQRLRAKRAELAGLRNEHAALLRRYATAETERASALEGRRLLEIEAGAPVPETPALPPARAAETDVAEAEAGPAVTGVFSPEGSQLFMRAMAALARFGTGDETAEADADAVAKGDETAGAAGAAKGEGLDEGVTEGAARESVEPTGFAEPAEPAEAGTRSTGHFTVPTAVAVVPASPVRRPAVEGGFDFFGTQKDTPSDALDAVQNEDLADVVGQEALAVHKAESEAGFKPADEEFRGVGQVIDLTAHDETEHIDLHGLRSAAS